MNRKSTLSLLTSLSSKIGNILPRMGGMRGRGGNGGPVVMATASCSLLEDAHEIHLPQAVKVVVDRNHFALYFSRAVIPYDRDRLRRKCQSHDLADAFIANIWGFMPIAAEFLLTLASTSVCELGTPGGARNSCGPSIWVRRFMCSEVTGCAHGVDTPEDYAAFVKR